MKKVWLKEDGEDSVFLQDHELVPGLKRFDEEGNDLTYSHEIVTQYWLRHYVSPEGLCCSLCDNRGIIYPQNMPRQFCICPNGQAARWFTTKKED